jgi:hypothetical protein
MFWVLLIPDYDPDNPEPYPGNIQPGQYTMSQLVRLLREHAEEPDAIRFIADMLEN